MNIDELIQLQVLKLKAAHSGAGSRTLEEAIEQAGTVQLRQMCAKVSPKMYEDLEGVCAVLELSKRAFIEAAVSDAIRRAQIRIGEAVSQKEI